LRCSAARSLTADQPLTIDRIEVESAASATIHCTGATGSAVTVTFSIAPILPPRIQEYEAVVKP
jgi:hypothetical protein